MVKEAKDKLLEIAQDARLKIEKLEEIQDSKQDLDENFYYNAGQIEAYNAIANILEKLANNSMN